MKCKSSRALTLKRQEATSKEPITSACEQVKRASRLHNDNELRHIIPEEDLIAKEFKMHEKCYNIHVSAQKRHRHW